MKSGTRVGGTDSSQSDDDDDHQQFVDPTPFLDPIKPILTWNEECREYTVKVLNLVIDTDALTKGFDEIITDVLGLLTPFGPRYFRNNVPEPLDVTLPETMNSVADKISEGIDQDPANLKNVFMFGG